MSNREDMLDNHLKKKKFKQIGEIYEISLIFKIGLHAIEIKLIPTRKIKNSNI